MPVLSLVPKLLSQTGGSAPDGSVVKLTTISLTADAMLELTLKNMSVEADARAILDTYPSADSFSMRLLTYFTHLFPSPQSSSLASDVLTCATSAYLSSTRMDPREQLATFLCAGVKAATYGMSEYTVSTHSDLDSVVWNPWDDGPLSSWAPAASSSIRFDRVDNPSANSRYITSTLLQRQLLSYRDMATMQKSGIDMRSLDLF